MIFLVYSSPAAPTTTGFQALKVNGFTVKRGLKVNRFTVKRDLKVNRFTVIHTP